MLITMIIYGIAIVPQMLIGKALVFKGWLALASMSLGLFVLSIMFSDGIDIRSIISTYPYGFDEIPPQITFIKYIIVILAFFGWTFFMYWMSYFVSIFVCPLMIESDNVGKSKFIDYIVAPIAFVTISFSVFYKYIIF